MKNIITHLIVIFILLAMGVSEYRIYGYEIVDEGNGYVKVEVEYVLPDDALSYDSGIYIINGSTLQLHRKKFKAVQFGYTQKMILQKYYAMNVR